MLAYLTVSNDRILLFLNHALAGSGLLYGLALWLSHQAAGACVFVTIVALWLWPDPEDVRALTTVTLPDHAGAARRWFRRSQLDIELKQATTPARAACRPTTVSRAQALILCGVAFFAYILARLLAQGLEVDRPFASFLPVMGNLGAFDSLRPDGSFPGSQAVVLGAFAAAMFHWHKVLGWLWVTLAIVFSVAGSRNADSTFHRTYWRQRSLVFFAARVALRAYLRDGWFQNCMDALARGFLQENSPYCYFLYAIVIIIGLESDHAL